MKAGYTIQHDNFNKSCDEIKEIALYNWYVLNIVEYHYITYYEERHRSLVYGG